MFEEARVVEVKLIPVDQLRPPLSGLTGAEHAQWSENSALEALSAQLLECDDAPAAIEAALAAVTVEPLRESAHRAVVQAHLREGNLAEALRQYEAYRYIATTELGILPSEHIESLVQPLRTNRPGAHR